MPRVVRFFWQRVSPVFHGASVDERRLAQRDIVEIGVDRSDLAVAASEKRPGCG